MAALLSDLSIDPRHIMLKKISVREIWNLRTLWKHVDCRWQVFLSLDEKNLCNVFHYHYLKKGKHFLEFLLHFRNLQKIFCNLKKNVTFITSIFRKLLTRIYMVTWMPKVKSEILGLLVTRWLPITTILALTWKIFLQNVPLPLSQERKTFSGIFIAFLESP